jgi:tetratricopeptide (TPR) repeat protein
MTKRFTVALAILLYAFVVAPIRYPAHAKDAWVSVRSNNFFLVGNASEKEVRQVATRLEQFRDVFSRLFPRMTFTSPVPTTVVVFKDDSSYKPFKPLTDGQTLPVAGYFQSGRAVNYITLTTEKREESPYAVIFHEYVHLLVNNTLGRTSVPPWFNEGLAEYYSTFDVEDDQKVHLGKLISSHLQLMRTSQLVPLDKLFAIDYYSLDRNKHDARGLFYAQSWVLIHYLIQGNHGKRAHQFGVFLDQLMKNVPAEQAFRQVFQTDYAGMQNELRDYIQRRSYRRQTVTFEKKLEFDAGLKAAPISDAEARAVLGDLLFHIQRPEDAKRTLEQALALDAKLSMAHASLGMVLMQQKKFSEAKEHLLQAVAGNSTNYLAHYYYAYALSREFITEGQPVYGLPTETVRIMRAELGRAIQLKPDFPESYHLLAFVNLVAGQQFDESIVMIKRALELSPGSEEFLFVLAQLHLRKQDFDSAREVIEPLAANGVDPNIRARAGLLLASISSIQDAMARFHNGREEQGVGIIDDTQTDEPLNSDPMSYLRDALRRPLTGERQVQGTLARIDCDSKGIVFTLRSDTGILRLKTASFGEMSIKTFAPDVSGEISCGVRKPENTVVVCYLPGSDVGSRTGGAIRSIEFVPSDFKLHP